MRSHVALLFALLLALPVFAKNGAFRSSAHGSREKGPQRRADRERGSCVQCHSEHASHDVSLGKTEHALFGPDDNTLCFACHSAPLANGIFAGSGVWSQSAHALSAQVVRRGRSSEDVNKCTNCHDPHGVRDSSGLVPSMLTDREKTLCLECHDGSRGADVRSQTAKVFAHGMRARGSHSADEAGDPQRFSAMPGSDRHVSCSDCHNAHRAAGDRMPPYAPEASARLQGVSRVVVQNGPAGSAPSYQWRGADDPAVVNEYEICFKCHSSWTRQPAGQPNLAVLTNPDNASYHPIQAAGKNRNIDPNAFANGYTSESLVRCTDCHGSDDAIVRGPHGSSYEFLLKRPSPTSADEQQMPTNALCFDCHAYAVYADAGSPEDVLRASRFNQNGHAFHTAQRVPCFACHETHGSAREPALIARGRLPGLTSYRQTATGGTCNATCHASKSYTIGYPR